MPSVQAVNQSAHELLTLDKDPRRKDSPVVRNLEDVNRDWQALSVQLMNATYKFNELREQMLKYHKTKKTVVSWFELIEARLIKLPPFGIDPKAIKKQMTEQQVRINNRHGRTSIYRARDLGYVTWTSQCNENLNIYLDNTR